MNDLYPEIVAEVRAAYESEGRVHAVAALCHHHPPLSEAAARAIVERVLGLPGESWDAPSPHPPWISPPPPRLSSAPPASRADRR